MFEYNEDWRYCEPEWRLTKTSELIESVQYLYHVKAAVVTLGEAKMLKIHYLMPLNLVREELLSLRLDLF